MSKIYTYSLMTGLGCDFLTEQCSDHNIFPYLCDTSVTQLVCTYDHLTKVCSYNHFNVIVQSYRIVMLQGDCATYWGGFDGCPVAVASEIEYYCRTEAAVRLKLKEVMQLCF